MQPSFQQFVCLSGLPRTGSTLLSAILSQNPKIHAEGNSPVCPLMWEMCNSITKCREQFQANNKEHLVVEYLKHIPHFYYQDIKEPIVLDKCRSWTHHPNYELAKCCIDPSIKVIVMMRPILEIVASFAKLYTKNNIKGEELNKELHKLFVNDSDPLMRSLQGLKNAKERYDSNSFLFVNYEDLIQQPKQTIQKIYDFCGWEYYDHDFENIRVKYPENDEVYKLHGYHSIRNKIEKEYTDIRTLLTDDIIQKCSEISFSYKI